MNRGAAACASALLASVAALGDSEFTPFFYTFSVAHIADVTDNDPWIERQVDRDGYYDASADADGVHARIIGQPSIISYTATSSAANMFALAFSIESFLGVSEETDVLVEWDFGADTADDLWITSYIDIEDFEDNLVVLRIGRDTPVGRAVIHLMPERNYYWTGAAVAFDGSGTSWFRLTPYDCPADLDRDGALTVFDFLAFQTAFSNENPTADLAPPFGEFNVFDFLAFQAAFGEGCP